MAEGVAAFTMVVGAICVVEEEEGVGFSNLIDALGSLATIVMLDGVLLPFTDK